MLYKIFLIFCFILPFQVALNPSEGVDLAASRVIILILFLVCLASSLKNKKLLIPKNIQTGLILSFLFLNLISFLVAKNSDWSLRKLMFLFSIFPVYFVTYYLITNKERLITATKSLVLGGVLVSIIGIIQFFSQFIFGLRGAYSFWANYIAVPFLGKSFSAAVLQNPSWLVNISGKTYLRATATFPDPHMLSFFLGIIFSLALGIFLISKKKFFWATCLILLAGANFLTFSRGGYLAVLVGIIFLIIFFWKKISVKSKSFFGVAIVLLVFLFIIPNPISQRYFSIFDLREGSSSSRIEIWKKTGEVIVEKPLLGTGIGNYSLEMKPTATYREPFYAHNTYLDIASETGIANALVWVGIMFFFCLSFIKKAKKQFIFLGPSLGIVLFSVHSLVETAIYSPVVLALFLIILSFNNVEFKNENNND